MISNFSPKEVHVLLSLPEKRNLLSERIANYPNCKDRFKELVALVDRKSVSIQDRKRYDNWTG
jgi:hypothetical protein